MKAAMLALTVLVFSLLAGCKSTYQFAENGSQIIQEAKQHITYFRHSERCFAAITFRTYGTVTGISFTMVNCTDDIK